MSLADIRARLQAQDTRGQSTTKQPAGDKAVYPFWDMDEGTTATVRFLPDSDTSNSFFWVERAMIKLPFAGVKGQNENKQIIVQVPCMEMYGASCPILAEVRTWYKDESLKEMANKYWKKRTYLFQGFVRQNALSDDVTPENPIRRFVISPQIFGVIKSSLMDPEIEELPTDYTHGLDFKIVKGKKGDYADYSTSGWARKESALSEVERTALEVHGLYSLKDFLPKKPNDNEVRIIKEMFEASVDGQLYDPDRWASYFKPWGLQSNGAGKDVAEDVEYSAPAVSVPVTKITKVEAEATVTTPPWEDESKEPVNKANAAPTGDKAQEILKMIRSRQNKPA